MKICRRCHEEFGDEYQVCLHDGDRLLVVSRTDDLIGQVIDGRYRILAKIGTGGFGSVYGAL